MIFYVAGHAFEDRMDAICQKLLPNGQPCCIAWPSIKHCRTDEYVNKPDIAHIGNATTLEIGEIDTHAAREDAMIERAYSAITELSKR
jgi:hypothetical protein